MVSNVECLASVKTLYTSLADYRVVRLDILMPAQKKQKPIVEFSGIFLGVIGINLASVITID